MDESLVQPYNPSIIIPEVVMPEDKKTALAVMGIKGFARFVLRDKNLNILRDTGWFPNLITNGGMIHIRDLNNYLNYGAIGTSTAAPAQTDTACNAQIGTRASVNFVVAAWAAANAYYYRRNFYRFLEGNGTGTIAEAAIHTNTTGANAFAHFRIPDSGGLPTTIAKAADQILDVYYEIRNYPTLVDAVGTIDISGVTYNYIARAAGIGQDVYWDVGQGREIQNNSFLRGYSGNIGPNTDIPTGSSSSVNSVGAGTIITGTGSYFNDLEVTIPLDDCNFAGGLRSFRMKTGSCTWQWQYNNAADTTAIPKTVEKRLRLRFRLAWVRL